MDGFCEVETMGFGGQPSGRHCSHRASTTITRADGVQMRVCAVHAYHAGRGKEPMRVHEKTIGKAWGKHERNKHDDIRAAGAGPGGGNGADGAPGGDNPSLSGGYVLTGFPIRTSQNSVALVDGRTVSLFVNVDTGLVVLDLLDADRRGGTELYRATHTPK